MTESLKLWALTDIIEDKEEEVSFHGCQLVDEHLSEISEALSKNKSLKRLILNGNPQLTGHGMAVLLRALPEESAVEEIFLWGCDMGDVDVRVMTEALASNRTIKSLWLEDREKLRGTGKEKEIAADIEVEAKQLEEKLDWESAVGFYKTALQVKTDELGPNHLYVADTHRRLAHSYEKLKNIDDALEHHKSAWLVHTKLRGPDHLDLADSNHDVGRIMALQGYLDPITRTSAILDEALERLHLALEIRLNKLAPEMNLSIAKSHFFIGVALQKKEQVDAALGKYEDALAVHIARGEDDASAGDAHLAIGEICRSREQWKEAKEHFVLASELFIQHLGAGEMKVATAYFGEAAALQQLGQFLKAIEKYEASMKIEISYIGSDQAMFSEKVAHIYLAMADCHHAFGDLPAGIEKTKLGAMCYSNMYGATDARTEAIDAQADEWQVEEMKEAMFS